MARFITSSCSDSALSVTQATVLYRHFIASGGDVNLTYRQFVAILKKLDRAALYSNKCGGYMVKGKVLNSAAPGHVSTATVDLLPVVD